jgi:hypothetical protein
MLLAGDGLVTTCTCKWKRPTGSKPRLDLLIITCMLPEQFAHMNTCVYVNSIHTLYTSDSLSGEGGHGMENAFGLAGIR